MHSQTAGSASTASKLPPAETADLNTIRTLQVSQAELQSVKPGRVRALDHLCILCMRYEHVNPADLGFVLWLPWSIVKSGNAGIISAGIEARSVVHRCALHCGAASNSQAIQCWISNLQRAHACLYACLSAVVYAQCSQHAASTCHAAWFVWLQSVYVKRGGGGLLFLTTKAAAVQHIEGWSLA